MASASCITQEEFSYGDHELQRLSVYHLIDQRSQDNARHWIIYVHGGAWRDPTIDQTSFLPAINHLLSTPTYQTVIQQKIEAFASINYRLSAHPSHPQDPTITPPTQYRNATHPDHLNDVIAALRFLQVKYGFTSNYTLVGHSCGATLALQIPMKIPIMPQNPEIIIGIAGIYDLRLLRDSNSHPAYQEFLAGAFGKDEEVWDKVSPAKYDDIGGVWGAGHNLVLVSSSGDGLVDDGQIDEMGVKAKGWEGGIDVDIRKGMLSERHDDIWQKGEGLAGVIGEILIKSVEKKIL